MYIYTYLSISLSLYIYIYICIYIYIYTYILNPHHDAKTDRDILQPTDLCFATLRRTRGVINQARNEAIEPVLYQWSTDKQIPKYEYNHFVTILKFAIDL